MKTIFRRLLFMKILDCRGINRDIRHGMRKKVERMANKPKLAILQVGDRPDSSRYVSTKKSYINGIGAQYVHYEFPEDTIEEAIAETIHKCNTRKDITGIMLQLPLPEHLDAQKLVSLITPSKDVDCLTPTNQGLLSMGRCNMPPCTPAGIMYLLNEHLKVDLPGKRALVIGRSDIVGKPIAHMLTNESCTVTLAHSKTYQIDKLIREADIIVVAVGKPKFITINNPDAIVFDVGINFVDGKMCGDVDIDNSDCAIITPVPFGIGQMTTAMLLKNLYTAAVKQFKEVL